MTIRARYSSECPGCGAKIEPGTLVTWSPGTRARHPGCAGQTAVQRRQARRYGSTYTRFSSGAEVFTNRAGRCEDAPCCGCCTI